MQAVNDLIYDLFSDPKNLYIPTSYFFNSVLTSIYAITITSHSTGVPLLSSTLYIGVHSAFRIDISSLPIPFTTISFSIRTNILSPATLFFSVGGAGWHPNGSGNQKTIIPQDTLSRSREFAVSILFVSIYTLL